MVKKTEPSKGLIIYYGILQSAHLVALIRAGILMLSGNAAPFPILQPTSGWGEQSMAFMFGLAGMDVVGIFLGIIFSFNTLVKLKFRPLLGIISLTIFISGAIIFGVGTFASSAWFIHPLSYWIMAALFSPSPILYYQLLMLNP